MEGGGERSNVEVIRSTQTAGRDDGDTSILYPQTVSSLFPTTLNQRQLPEMSMGEKEL